MNPQKTVWKIKNHPGSYSSYSEAEETARKLKLGIHEIYSEDVGRYVTYEEDAELTQDLYDELKSRRS